MTFVRGDVNRDESINLADPVAILAILFGGDPLEPCNDAADTNDDGLVNIADPIAILSHLFGESSHQGLPAPFPQAGDDPTSDGMLCFK